MCAAAFAEGEAAPEAVTADVIDFEDGNFAFLGLSTAKANADASTVLEIAECNGSKALKVTANGKVPYVALNVEGLLGARFADVAAISADFAADLRILRSCFFRRRNSLSEKSMSAAYLLPAGLFPPAEPPGR